jgi:glyoxylase-like metal-dependent hydrolase (beta-lactamase superfamily II)
MSDRPGRRIWIAVAAALLMVACLVFSNSFTKLFLKVPLLDGSTVTVVQGVHLIGGIGPAAAYVVETSDGLALIDTGLDDDAGKLKAEMKTLGLDWKRLRVIFLTHVHGDHCGGAERLRAETGARVYAGRGDVSAISAGESRDAFFSTFSMPNHSPHPTHVDHSLQGGESIPVGNVTFQILDTPGHTLGSVCYLMEKSGLRILFSGDVIYRLGDKPLGTYSAYLAPRYRGNARQYLASLEKLRSVPVPDLVLPGHPNASRTAQSPRMNRQAWNDMLEGGIHEMKRLVGRFDSDGANFLNGEPKELVPGLYYFGDFKGAAIYGLSAGSEFAVIDAPGGAGLLEFLHERRKQLGLPPAKPTAVLLTNCRERETAGLNDLIEQTRAHVFVAEAGMEPVRALCPSGTTIVPTNDHEKLRPFPVSPIELGTPGTTLVVYLLRSSNKTALISGRIPTGGNHRTIEELLSSSGNPALTPAEYIGVLRNLLKIHPDLWLPTSPVNAQNANLYDREWQAVLEKEYKAATTFLPLPSPP